ncbi:ABC transporter permease subunit [Listeria immobilis]|uniref:ABC transporter permease subunit n=1 Tax=Listeria immobilis TaxID=2713502 RepID=UPI0016269636|nr:ABC transporter permease subunit [Listeria immobilis]MBC1516447.1 ABC transporter permease subunit [Listeria immobilis]
MIALVKNEFYKLFLRKSSWIMQIVLFLIVLMLAVLMLFVSRIDSESTEPSGGAGINVYYDTSGAPVSEDDYWNSADKDGNPTYKTENLSLTDSLAYLKQQEKAASSKAEKEALQQQIDFYQPYVDAGEKPVNNPTGISSANFFATLGNSAAVATMLVVIVASMIVATEFSAGTIKLLLTRPYSRSQILFSKYLVCILYSIISSITLFLSGFIFSFILPSQSIFMPLAPETGAMTAWTFAWTMLGTNFLLMIVYATIAFFFSSVVRSQALAVGVGVGILFSGGIIRQLLPIAIEKYEWMKWILFNLLSLNDTVGGTEIAGNLADWQVIAGLGVYTAIILFFTFFIFKKRDVALS